MGGNLGGVPGVDQISVVGGLVLVLVRRFQVVIVDALHADKHLGAARLPRQRNEILDFVRQHVHLHDELDHDAVGFPQADDRLENFSPLLVAGKVVVRKEVEADARFFVVLLDGIGDRFRVAHAHLAALHIDDRAEAATEGTAAPAVDGAKLFVCKALQVLFVDHGDRRGMQIRRRVQVVVHRLQLVEQGIAQEVFPVFFHLAAHNGNAEVQDFLDVGRRGVEKGEGAADVKAANDDRQSRVAKLAGQIDRAGILVGLYAGETDDGFPAGPFAASDYLANVDFLDGLIQEFDTEIQVFSQRLATLQVFGKAIQAGHRITGQHAAPVAQHVAIVVILGWLQQYNVQASNVPRSSLDVTLGLTGWRINGKQTHEGNSPARV